MSLCMSEITLSLNALPAGPENMASVLAPMLYVATVNETPPGVEARAATGGALLLAMAAAPAKVRVVRLTSLRNSCVVD